MTYELTEGLYHEGHECTVLCANTENYTHDEVYNGKYRVIRAASYGRLFSTSISWDLIKIFKKIANDFDIIHVHFPDPLTAFAIWLVKPHAKLVIHWHSDIIKQKFLLKFYLPLQNYVLKRADLIIGTSPKYINESFQLADFLYKSISIPLGSEVAVTDLTSIKKQELAKRFHNKRLLFGLGRLVYYKGFDYLIRALKDLPDDYVLAIGGEGPDYKKLNSLIRKYNLEHRAFLIGKIPQSDLAAWYDSAFIFCFPSTHASEAFGVSQIEAMSFSKPIVATNIPNSGVSWVNQNYVSGINVEPKKVEALKDAILEIGNNTGLYEKLAIGARDRYEKLFKPQEMVNSIIYQYHKLVRPVSYFKNDIPSYPKVSIITVLLDSKRFIQSAIESVLSQTYENIEYIIIDGGSEDGSVEIINNYLDKIDVFISEKDNGVYDAINKGIAKSTGDIIGLLHSDDFFVNAEVVNEIVDCFRLNQTDAVFGDLEYVSNSKNSDVIRVWKANPYHPALFYKGWMPPHPTFYVKRSVYERFGAYDTRLKFAADYELMLRFILKHQISLSYLPKVLVKMRVGGASNRNILNRIKANIEDRKAWKIVGINPGFLTLVLKPLKKIFQYSIFKKSWNKNR